MWFSAVNHNNKSGEKTTICTWQIALEFGQYLVTYLSDPRDCSRSWLVRRVCRVCRQLWGCICGRGEWRRGSRSPFWQWGSRKTGRCPKRIAGRNEIRANLHIMEIQCWSLKPAAPWFSPRIPTTTTLAVSHCFQHLIMRIQSQDEKTWWMWANAKTTGIPRFWGKCFSNNNVGLEYGLR